MLTTIKQFNNKLGLNKWSTKEKKILLISTLKEDNNICVCVGAIYLTLHRDIKKGVTDLMNLIKYYYTKSRKDDQIYCDRVEDWGDQSEDEGVRFK